MLTFYRERKWTLPALASPNDLLLLKQIKSFQAKDKKLARRKKLLVHEFHQVNYMATIGVLIGFVMTALEIYLFWGDLIHQTKNSFLAAVLVASFFAGILFCYFIRIFGMWSVRRKMQKLIKQPVG